MIGIDIQGLIEANANNAKQKWKLRTEGEKPELQHSSSINLLKGIPNEWCIILRQQFGKGTICGRGRGNEKHMEEIHKIDIIPYDLIWEDIKNFYNRQQE